MQLSNCFMLFHKKFSSSRLVFQHGPEQPSRAPESSKNSEEKPSKKPGKDVVEVARARTEKLRQNKFKERVDGVQELQKQLAALEKERRETRGGVGGWGWKTETPMQATKRELIRDQMADIAKQFNAELRLNIDFSKLKMVDLAVSGKGIHMSLATADEGYDSKNPDKKWHNISVGLRPDGTFQTKIESYPENKVAWFDSRMGKRAEYNLPRIGEEGFSEKNQLLQEKIKKDGFPDNPSTE